MGRTLFTSENISALVRLLTKQGQTDHFAKVCVKPVNEFPRPVSLRRHAQMQTLKMDEYIAAQKNERMY